MSPRYVPILTDGQLQRSIYEWRNYAKDRGYVFETVGPEIREHYRILDYTSPGKPMIIKNLDKIKVTRKIK